MQAEPVDPPDSRTAPCGRPTSAPDAHDAHRRTRKAPGGAVLLAVLSAACGGDGGTAPPGGDDTPHPTSVRVAPGSTTLDWLGATAQFTATVIANTGATLSTPVTWSTSSSAVATIASNGTATAVGVGTTTITGKAGSVSGTATLTVRQLPASITKVSGDAQTGPGGEELAEPLVVEVRDQGDQTIAAAPLSWSVNAGDGVLAVSSTQTDASGRGQTTWALGAHAGNQSVMVSSGPAGAVTFTADATEPVVASVVLSPDADTVAVVGDTARFTGVASTASGATIEGADVVYSVTDESIASVSESGLVTAKAVGTTKVIATSGAVADTSTFVVLPPHLVVISSVEPALLLEGQAATIHGSGFATTSGDNAVSVGGLPATVTAASATSLSITVPESDCLPPRQAELLVTADGDSGTRMVPVSPLSSGDLDLPAENYRYTLAGNGCLYLPGGDAGAEYLIGAVSTSETVSSLTPIRLTGVAGDVGVLTVPPRALAASSANVPFEDAPFAMGPALTGRRPVGAPRTATSSVARPPFTGLPEVERVADADMTARNLALVDELGPVRRPGPSLAPPQQVAVGDTITLWADYNRTCATSEQVRAVVRYVGTNAIWLEDVDNPSDPFTQSELSDLDAFYTASAKAVHDTYYGGLSDVDANGKILILMTKQVNKVNVGGWVWFTDLYPMAQCSTSNYAEIFFGQVPDPAGVYGNVQTRQGVLDYYPIVLTHEITHLVQANARVYGNAAAKTTWELEGGAKLDEQLVAYGLFGHGSGMNLGYAEYVAGTSWYYGAWLYDMFNFFGWDSDDDQVGRVVGAPEQCSWVGRPEEGNTGPCRAGNRAVYGVPSMLLRFTLDRWGSTYPGGEVGIVRRLTQSPLSGFASLVDISGWAIERILAEFYIALWADGRVYDAFGMTSWDLYDILDRYADDKKLQPYESTMADWMLDASVRAGSSVYMHWSPAGMVAPSAIRVTTQGGGPAPPNVAVWALRVR